MDEKTPGPVTIVLMAHALLLAAAMIVTSAAIAAAMLAYPHDPTRMVLAGTLATILLVLPATLIAYPLTLRYLLRRFGYSVSWRRLLGLTASLVGLAAFAALITAGSQSGSGQVSDVDVLLIALGCGWTGSLLGQIGIASALSWDHPGAGRKASTQRPAGSRQQRREHARQQRRSGR
jgi:hypothetical protein